MAAFATHVDVAESWRSLTSDEETVADRLLDVAAQIMRRRVSTLDADIEAGTVDELLVKHVNVEMVKRAMRNAPGVEEQTTGPFRTKYIVEIASGYLHLTAGERAMLRPPGARPRRVGTIRTRSAYQ